MQGEIYCKHHKNYVIQYIDLSNQTMNLECAQCIMDKFNQNQKIEEIKNRILLYDVMQNPYKLVSFLKVDYNIDEFFKNFQSDSEITAQFQIWEQKMRDCQKSIDLIINQQKEIVFQVINSQKEIKNKLQYFFRQEEIISLINEMRKTNEKQECDSINQIESKLKAIFEDLLKNNSLNEQINPLIMKYKNQSINLKQIQLSTLLEQLQQLEVQQKQLGTIVSFNDNNVESKLISSNYLNELLEYIKSKHQKQILKIQNIFIGSRDGLNIQSFWQAIENKSNLLFVLKSKNQGNNVFGAYSPLQFKSSIDAYVKDPTNISFILSYTNQEIYPIIPGSDAIHCSMGNALWFGRKGDIGIRADFQESYSKLGDSYKWDKYQGEFSSHLYGGLKPNVAECEVYEIQIAQ